MMEKREKLLAIYGAIPPRVWEEMALQLLRNPPKFKKRVWGFNYTLFTIITCG